MNSKNKKTIIYGIQAVKQAIMSNTTIEVIYLVKNDKKHSMQKLFPIIRRRNIPFQYVPKVKLDILTGYASHQGILADIGLIDYHTLDSLLENSTNSLLLMLEQITDIRNFGGIIRTAECAGVSGIIIPQKNSAKINPVSIKTSAGAIFHIPICRELNLKNTLKKLKNKNYQIIASVENSSTYYTKIDYTLPSVIVVGSENKGIGERLLKHTDHTVSIPMFGKIPSLNVSVASAVLLFEAVRQRQNQ